MALKKTALVISKSGKGEGEAIALNAEAPIKMKAMAHGKYLLKSEDGVAPENATLVRVGDDLQIIPEGQTAPAVVLEGYFLLGEPAGLFGVAEDGRLYEYGLTDGGEIFSLSPGEMTAVALAGDPVATDGNDDGGVFWPLLMFGGVAAGGLVAAMSGGSSSAPVLIEPVKVDPPQPKIMPAPSQPTATADVRPIIRPVQNHGETDDQRPE